MLGVFITSRVRRKIITVFAKFPDYRTHIRGLADLINEDVAGTYRELQRLEKIGFLTTTKKGKSKIYATNRQFPLFIDLHNLVMKSQLMEDRSRRRSLKRRPSQRPQKIG